ncbi:MAG: citryl-CoA lyase [Dethiobacter sp.]|nr:citryl-CoA lyase [Dethiobacter sp.]
MDDNKAWWETEIINVRPDSIEFRGYKIQDLIGSVTYPEMLLLLLKGELPGKYQARLLEGVLVAGCDHGPNAPSVAAARMAATCGISFNSCIATGINVLGDIHGGAGEQSMEIFYQLSGQLADDESNLPELADALCREFKAEGKKLPGFGHRFHKIDPRAAALDRLAQEAKEKGEIEGKYFRIAHALHKALRRVLGIELAINIDGISAAALCELGLPAKVFKGVFSLSRGMGLVAHALEEYMQGSRLKGPCPKNDETLVKYTGVGEREFPSS